MASSAPSLELCPGRWIGSSHPVFLIAEIGQNHQGDVQTAKKMISAARHAGVDCVKFQKSSLADKFNGLALAREYSGPQSWGQTYGEHKEHLELSEQDYRDLQEHAHKEGVFFTASAMDSVSAIALEKLDVPFVKIGSGDSNNLMLQEEVARRGRPLVVSTGMSSMDQVRMMVSTITRHTAKLVLLQCTSSYPTAPADVRLGVMETFRREFPAINIGYSGHETGLAISVAAAALGATVIERHFTLDKSWKGSDHRCSLEPGEMEILCHHVRNNTQFLDLKQLFTSQEMDEVQEALEGSDKELLQSELACQAKLGKTIVAKHDIAKNTVISADDILIKVAEPKGIDPLCEDLYIGRVALTDIKADCSIQSSMLGLNSTTALL